jgi:hypothetical protein
MSSLRKSSAPSTGVDEDDAELVDDALEDAVEDAPDSSDDVELIGEVMTDVHPALCLSSEQSLLKHDPDPARYDRFCGL